MCCVHFYKACEQFRNKTTDGKDLLRYPLDKEGVSALGRHVCLAHAKESL